jgi:hypothetical protein
MTMDAKMTTKFMDLLVDEASSLLGIEAKGEVLRSGETLLLGNYTVRAHAGPWPEKYEFEHVDYDGGEDPFTVDPRHGKAHTLSEVLEQLQELEEAV